MDKGKSNNERKSAKNRVKLHNISVGSIIIHIIHIFIVLIIMVPVLNLVAKSFSEPLNVSSMKGWQIWPSGFSLNHYKAIITNNKVWSALYNSVVITVIGTALSLVLTCSAAYVLTRPGLPGKKLIMIFLTVIMIVEPTIIQQYMVVRGYGLLNKLWSMILYNTVSVYYLIVLMRYFGERNLHLAR